MAITSFFGGPFFGGEFFHSGGPTPVTPVDTHDGFDSEVKKHHAQRDARARLREQIRLALEGPQAETVRKALTPYSKKSDAQPFIETVDLARVEKRLANMKALQKILREQEVTDFANAALQAIEDDDEDIFLLL